MAHARGMFNEVLNNDYERASYALGEIQKLYTIESISKEANLNFAELQVVRSKKADPILKGMWLWMQRQYSFVLPTSAIGKALAYIIERWHKLSIYTTDGRLKIDIPGGKQHTSRGSWQKELSFCRLPRSCKT